MADDPGHDHQLATRAAATLFLFCVVVVAAIWLFNRALVQIAAEYSRRNTIFGHVGELRWRLNAFQTKDEVFFAEMFKAARDGSAWIYYVHEVTGNKEDLKWLDEIGKRKVNESEDYEFGRRAEKIWKSDDRAERLRDAVKQSYHDARLIRAYACLGLLRAFVPRRDWGIFDHRWWYS